MGVMGVMGVMGEGATVVHRRPHERRNQREPICSGRPFLYQPTRPSVML